MDTILSVVLSSIQADVARVERVAMNIANAQTPGYKREVVAAAAFGTQLAAAADAVSVHTDHRPGSLKATGQALDLALAGPGWFEVATPEGSAYTRDGHFRLDAQGRIVTQHGLPVLGEAGEIVLLQGNPVIDVAGRVFEAQPAGSQAASRRASAPVAQLKVVQFDAAAPLRRLGDGLVLPAGEPATVKEGALQVRQGFLENSNVSHLHEMVQLLQTVRHVESLQKVALGYDEMLGATIRKLGETT
jgi:flagellar basal-body rod protein FlgG